MTRSAGHGGLQGTAQSQFRAQWDASRRGEVLVTQHRGYRSGSLFCPCSAVPIFSQNTPRVQDSSPGMACAV